MYQNQNNGIYSISLLVGSAFTFAYCFGVAIHEIGHVLAYQYYGIPTIEFVLDPLGHSYMEPVRDHAPGELLQRSGGSLFNIICASLVASFFVKNHNLYAFPIMMWVGAAFIQESIAIILDLINGKTHDWAFVVAEGIPVSLVLLVAAIFLLVGSAILLRLLAIAGVKADDSIKKIVTICLLGITPFFIISLIYVSFFLSSDDDNWVLSKSIALAASVVLSLVFALMFKPSFPTLEKLWPITNQTIHNSHVVFSMSLALFFIVFCAFFFN